MNNPSDQRSHGSSGGLGVPPPDASGEAWKKFSKTKPQPTHINTSGPALDNAVLYLTWLVPVLDSFPRSQRFLLGDRWQTLALDVVEHLIEATYTKTPQTALRRVNVALEKQRVLVRVAYNLRYLDVKRYEQAARKLDEIGQRVGAWLKGTQARHKRVGRGECGAHKGTTCPMRGCCAAALGTTIPGICAQPTATGIRPATRTTTSVFVSPVRLTTVRTLPPTGGVGAPCKHPEAVGVRLKPHLLAVLTLKPGTSGWGIF